MAAQTQLDEWSRQVADGGEVEISFDRRRTLVLVAIGGFFLAGAVVLLLDGRGLAFLALAVSSIGLLAFRRGFGPPVIVDDRSVRYEPWGIHAPWSGSPTRS